MQPKPETIFNDVLRRAFDLVHETDVSAHQLELKRLERDAEALARADRIGSFEVKAHIAAARSDFDAVDNLYERAFAMTSSVAPSVRYLILLGATDQCHKVKASYERFADRIRGVPDAVRTITALLVSCGWVQTAKQLGDVLEKMNLPRAGTPLAEGEHVFNQYQLDGFEESDVSEVVTFVRRFLRRHGVVPEMTESLVVPFESGSSALMYQFLVNQAPDAVAELEWDLFAALDEGDFVAERERNVLFALSSNRVIDANHLH